MVISLLLNCLLSLILNSEAEVIRGSRNPQLAIIKVNGEDKVVQVSNLDSTGFRTATWIERDQNCRFGVICNNKARTQRIKSDTAILSVPEISASIDNKRIKLKPGMYITTKQGAIVLIESVFNDGRIFGKQMEENFGIFKGDLLTSSGQSGIVNPKDFSGVQSDCTNKDFCVGQKLEWGKPGRPMCQDVQDEKPKFNANPEDKYKCNEISVVLMAFTDNTFVETLNGWSKTGYIVNKRYADQYFPYNSDTDSGRADANSNGVDGN